MKLVALRSLNKQWFWVAFIPTVLLLTIFHKFVFTAITWKPVWITLIVALVEFLTLAYIITDHKDRERFMYTSFIADLVLFYILMIVTH